MKEYIEYLRNAGLILFCVGLGWHLMKGYGTTMPHGEIGTWLICIGMLVTLPHMIYRFCHWSEYREENIWDTITIVTLILIAIWVIYIR